MAELFVIPRPDAPQNAPDGLPPDWEARERALDVRRSWIVEAPAGSGKTGLLIQRYLKLLGDESVQQPEQVLAITFTVKATNEMRERVMAQLESAAKGEALDHDSPFERETRRLAEIVLARDSQLDWSLLETPLRLKIRTIDSVCAEIARLLPVLSGGGGRQTPVNDPSPMYREAARQTMMQLGGADLALDDALRTVLLHRDGSLADFERLLLQMLPLRNQWGELVPLGRELDDEVLEHEVRPRLEAVLEEAVCAGLTQFASAVPQDFLERLCTLAVSFAEIEPYGRVSSPLAVCSSKIGLPANDATDLEYWRALIHLLVTSGETWRRSFARNHLGFETTSQQKAALRDLIDEISHRDDLLQAIKQVNKLPPAVYPGEQWEVAKALFRVLGRALAELQLVFARSGECDFTELGLLARTALEHEGAMEDLSAALGMQLQHLLVDEVQDTSTSQYRLIELLTQGWDGDSQTVFLVGDPKQSIYLFRQARVERFIRAMHSGRIGELPIETVRLTANFRSQRDLVETFNEDFSLLFPREVSAANAEDVPYVAAQPVRGQSKAGARGIVWHARTLDPEDDPDAKKAQRKKQSRREAAEVRAVVEQWRSRPLPERRTAPWKIAVLVRSRNLLGNIVAEFKDETKGVIPFRAVDIEALGERQEVLDLFALTRALRHPADRVAWLSVLRAPWCGLELAELHLLAGADDPDWAQKTIEQVIAERGDLLSEESCDRLARVWSVMQAARTHRAGLTMAQWVERTWRSLGGDVYLSNSEMTNARRYLQLLDEVEEQSDGIDLALLQSKLTRLYAEPLDEDGAVDLMTIHGAKGLEWDVVLVPGLQRRGQAIRGKLLDWDEVEMGSGTGIMLAPIAGRGEASKELNNWLRSIDKARESAEQKRLFYVACTRAREELHLFASPDRTATGEISRSGSLLCTAWPAAERHFNLDGDRSSTLPDTIETTFEMPLQEQEEDHLVADLAAAAESPARLLRRLPSGFDPEASFAKAIKLSYGEAPEIPFERPEGSFEARSFGNAVHAFIEWMTQRLAADGDVSVLKRDLAGWSARIAAVLRADGLSRAVVERLTTRVMSALTNILQDPEGLWILAAQNEAASEFALTSWRDRRSSVRLDRVFLAGATPLEASSDVLWVIDYKTTAHAREGIDEFLAGERKKYGPQMEAYAFVMRERGLTLRLGMYYPMLPRLLWWEPE